MGGIATAEGAELFAIREEKEGCRLSSPDLLRYD